MMLHVNNDISILPINAN